MLSNLDYADFYLSDPRALSIISTFFRKAADVSAYAPMSLFSLIFSLSQAPFPVDVLFGRWHNMRGQLSLLKAAVVAPPDIVSFAHCQRRVLIPGFELRGGVLSQTWSSLDLVDTLLSLSETPLYSQVKPLFDHPTKNCPETLLGTLASSEVFVSSFLLFSSSLSRM